MLPTWSPEKLVYTLRNLIDLLDQTLPRLFPGFLNLIADYIVSPQQQASRLGLFSHVAVRTDIHVLSESPICNRTCGGLITNLPQGVYTKPYMAFITKYCVEEILQEHKKHKK